MPSIAAVCNFLNEHNALPGFLECAATFFDEIVMVNAGPGGKASDDGSIDIIEKFGAKLVFDKIDDGFGALRTRMVRMSSCDWVMILDADERFWRYAPVLAWENGLPHVIGTYDQGEVLRRLCEQPVDMIVAGRRHWHDFSWTRPTQDWWAIADWQARIVRNREGLGYRTDVRMHEQAVDLRTGWCPRWYHPEQPDVCRVFYDHYHCWYKPMEVDQRAHDIRIYDALCEGRAVPAE